MSQIRASEEALFLNEWFREFELAEVYSKKCFELFWFIKTMDFSDGDRSLLLRICLINILFNGFVT